MKKYIYIILIYMTSLIASSCSDWFDVTAPSEIRKDDHFSSVTGFQQSLIGCYIGMTDDALYGTNLSWFATEIMAHQFNPYVNSTNIGLAYWLQSFNYTNTYTTPTVEEIWEKAYNVIVNVNDELANIEEKKEILDDLNYHIIKGELLAIRAYIHFDLLRLYGYGNWSQRDTELDEKRTIPYATEVSKDPAPQYSGAETIKLLLNDLNEAAALLKDYDPITKTKAASFYQEYNEEGFFNERTLRMNYYAVKALQARVYLWRGKNEDIVNALSAANEIITALENNIAINEMYTYCNFLTPETVNKSCTSMSRENIFGLNVSDVASRIVNYIKPYYLDSENTPMYLLTTDAMSLYENSATDIRLTTLMEPNTNAQNTGYTPLKVYQSDLANDYKNKISMIRIPEIYYIAAECYVKQNNPNLPLALNCLNTVREKRGLYTPLEDLDAEQILVEIQKEYHKEFLSEGVMFYYYKRTETKTIPNYTEDMEDAQYVLPYPEFEIQSGRVQ